MRQAAPARAGAPRRNATVAIQIALEANENENSGPGKIEADRGNYDSKGDDPEDPACPAVSNVILTRGEDENGSESRRDRQFGCDSETGRNCARFSRTGWIDA